MGFRSTFTTEDVGYTWPEWFRTKYAHYDVPVTGGFSSGCERKFYDKEFFEDTQKAIDWKAIKPADNFVVILLHECGGVTRVEITEDTIAFTEPLDWAKVEFIQHSYCYGCSSAKKAT